MKRLLLVMILSTVGLVWTGCGVGAGSRTFELGQEFSLGVGQSASIRGEDLEITFLKVVEDSRCPTDVQCIQAGRARSLVRFVSDNGTEERELTELGLADSRFRFILRDHIVSFHLEPYPEAGKQIADNEYRLFLAVSRVRWGKGYRTSSALGLSKDRLMSGG